METARVGVGRLERKSNMMKKRILMLAPTPFFSDRGCHIRILNSYLKLKKEGNIINILTYPLGRDVLDTRPIRVSKIWGYKKTSPGFSLYKPFLDILMFNKAKKLMKEKEYDFIYAHLHEGALIGIWLKKKFGKKVIFDAQGSLTGELSSQETIKKRGLAYKIIWPIEKYITENSDEIITSTEGLKEFMKNNFKIDKIKVEKDYPDKTLFNSRIKPVKLNLPKNKKIVVYLGGLQLYKGIDYLIKAIPLVNEKFHFLLMGYPIDDARKLAKKLGVENRITFTGAIPYERAASYLKLGDVAVSPKTLESGEANAKIYNYIAMNLPIVCFDMAETRQIKSEFPRAKMHFAKERNIKDLAITINGARI